MLYSRSKLDEWTGFIAPVTEAPKKVPFHGIDPFEQVALTSICWFESLRIYFYVKGQYLESLDGLPNSDSCFARKRLITKGSN